MSFRCSDCKTARDYCETPVRLVVKTRQRTPLPPGGIQSVGVGTGTEIAKEIEICIQCAVKRNPEDRELLRRLAASQRPRREMTGIETGS